MAIAVMEKFNLGSLLRKFSGQSEDKLLADYSPMFDPPKGKSIFDLLDHPPSMERTEFQKLLGSLNFMSIQQREKLKTAIQEMDGGKEGSPVESQRWKTR